MTGRFGLACMIFSTKGIMHHTVLYKKMFHSQISSKAKPLALSHDPRRYTQQALAQQKRRCCKQTPRKPSISQTIDFSMLIIMTALPSPIDASRLFGYALCIDIIPLALWPSPIVMLLYINTLHKIPIMAVQAICTRSNVRPSAIEGFVVNDRPNQQLQVF